MPSEECALIADPPESERPPVVLQVLPALVTGGVERGTVDVAGALVEAGWTGLVASNGGHMVRELDRLGAKHIQLPLHSKNPLVMRANIARLEQVIRQMASISSMPARGRRPGAPITRPREPARISSPPFMAPTMSGCFGLKKAYNAIMTRGERVIAISHFIADHIQAVYSIDPAKIRVVHRGIDIEPFRSRRGSARSASSSWPNAGACPTATGRSCCPGG